MVLLAVLMPRIQCLWVPNERGARDTHDARVPDEEDREIVMILKMVTLDHAEETGQRLSRADEMVRQALGKKGWVVEQSLGVSFCANVKNMCFPRGFFRTNT